ncbi:unnamed protein product [Rotaria magnacalcarata]|uniref:EGF-like domain-containing protein n=1 Tax=Rotaria magnacalcarata TaxID=392030 RepID=A0A816F9D4_9BILA|nr:unnamed protein product [Rotaria magnacalcarata]CAF1658274.1 unnamed protein product [Rotaria magnacalcarata]CAF1921459.1 unnamed protein product [Rotaria magnacalcarata]CAF3862137.1 unnamed protein product [Rotaria magnacalcarata]CAF4038686.1 unnamed protein product [Rotaria magnacalcarata]
MFFGASLFTMRIPYLNIPCTLNQTCFHGQCIHAEDFLIGWYEFCLCNQHYSGYECNEQTKLNRNDWFIISTCLTTCLCIVLCLLCVPFLHNFLEDDFYPQIIECTRSTPYVEISTPSSAIRTGMRIYRIPSDYLSRRRTIIDRLAPLHSISSLAYLTRIRNMRVQTRDEQIHI